MAVRSEMVSVDLGKDLLKLVEQRAKQEGITRSDYIREAIMLEFILSGDVEAMKFVVKKVGNRVKGVLAEKLEAVKLKEQVAQLIAP